MKQKETLFEVVFSFFFVLFSCCEFRCKLFSASGPWQWEIIVSEKRERARGREQGKTEKKTEEGSERERRKKRAEGSAAVYFDHNLSVANSAQKRDCLINRKKRNDKNKNCSKRKIGKKKKRRVRIRNKRQHTTHLSSSSPLLLHEELTSTFTAAERGRTHNNNTMRNGESEKKKKEKGDLIIHHHNNNRRRHPQRRTGPRKMSTYFYVISFFAFLSFFFIFFSPSGVWSKLCERGYLVSLLLLLGCHCGAYCEGSGGHWWWTRLHYSFFLFCSPLVFLLLFILSLTAQKRKDSLSVMSVTKKNTKRDNNNRLTVSCWELSLSLNSLYFCFVLLLLLLSLSLSPPSLMCPGQGLYSQYYHFLSLFSLRLNALLSPCGVHLPRCNSLCWCCCVFFCFVISLPGAAEDFLRSNTPLWQRTRYL